MTEIPEAVGPPCSVCEEFAAIMSLMNLADYSQTRLCGNCAPQFLGQLIAMMTGEVSESEAADAAHEVAAVSGEPEVIGVDDCPLCGETVPLAEIPAHVEAHASGELPVTAVMDEVAITRPDPLTENVVRSTHGHRKAKAAPEGGS